MPLSELERERVELLTEHQRHVPAREMRVLPPLSPDDVLVVQHGAREHPNARVRRDCLGVLDHLANDASTGVFRAAALSDPVPHVRLLALHGLACERCRVGELCVEDTVTDLMRVLEADPNAKVRHEAVFVIARLGRRDPRVPGTLARVASEDTDPLVRQVALAAAEGRARDVRSRKALRRRERGAR